MRFKKFFESVKVGYIFNFIAILMLFGVGVLYSQFNQARDTIIETNIDTQRKYTIEIVKNLKNTIF